MSRAKDPYFWYVVNATGLDVLGRYSGVSHTFRVVNDLDENYIPLHNRGGALTKAQVLAGTTFQFYNRAIFPGSFVFRAFTQIVEQIMQLRPPGFPASFHRGAFRARCPAPDGVPQTVVLADARLYTSDAVPLVEGTVYVYALDPGGHFYEASKQQAVRVKPS